MSVLIFLNICCCFNSFIYVVYLYAHSLYFILILYGMKGSLLNKSWNRFWLCFETFYFYYFWNFFSMFNAEIYDVAGLPIKVYYHPNRKKKPEISSWDKINIYESKTKYNNRLEWNAEICVNYNKIKIYVSDMNKKKTLNIKIQDDFFREKNKLCLQMYFSLLNYNLFVRLKIKYHQKW